MHEPTQQTTEEIPQEQPDIPSVTAQSVLDHVLALRVTAYDQDLLLSRLLTLENMIRTEIHFTDPLGTMTPETELIVQSPYSEVYEQYLLAQIDLMDMELEAYNAGMRLFTSTYGEYAARVRRDKRPDPGRQVSGYD